MKLIESHNKDTVIEIYNHLWEAADGEGVYPLSGWVRSMENWSCLVLHCPYDLSKFRSNVPLAFDTSAFVRPR